jgi:transcriptional regulator GlxA family with amidase domain
MAARIAGAPLYGVVIASPAGGLVAASSGTALATTPLRRIRLERRDTVLVSGGTEQALTVAIADRRLLGFVARAEGAVERLGSVCSGAFVLAAAGVLDGRRAATHWAACERLARFRPAVTVDRDAIFLRDGPVWTSAGVTTGIDMALAMVERDHGHGLADAVAAQLVLYVRRPGFQSQFSSALVAQQAGSAPLGPTIAWARAHLGATIEDLARHAGMSMRTFHRRCLADAGLTPAKLLDRLRVEHARSLFRTSRLTAKEVAAASGFSSPARMSAAFRRELGVLPSSYRFIDGARAT